jgi:protein CpxP
MRNSNKILTIAVVLLLITNIALVLFMVMDKKSAKKGPPNREEAFNMMAKELNMTEDQQKTYKLQKENFFKNNKGVFDSLRAARTAFFKLVKEPVVSDSLLDVYSQRITDRQAAIDKLTLAHFRAQRNLFTPEQQPKYDTFVQKMMSPRGRRDSADKK